MVVTKSAWLTEACWQKDDIQKAQVFNHHSANLLFTYKAGAAGPRWRGRAEYNNDTNSSTSPARVNHVTLNAMD